jgi:hypothetical protein
MPQNLPLSPPGGEEPDGFPPPGDGEGLGQGLYICTPPEQLTLAGFAQNGEADTMTPGPLLAAVVHAVTGEDGKGLGGCADDQLLGIISAARRMEARAAWTLLAATAEYAARHAGTRPADEFAPIELGYELHQSRSPPPRRWTTRPRSRAGCRSCSRRWAPGGSIRSS